MEVLTLSIRETSTTPSTAKSPFHALACPGNMSVMLELNTDLWTQQTGLERIASVTNLLYRAAESPGKRLSQLGGMVR